ncbi:MAG: SRPBCC family protein, partial [Halioglobus sp.]
MERIEKTILISAPAEKVFSLIEKFEEIPNFSSAISEVSCESDEISVWKIEVGGITHAYRAELLEKKPPSRLTWRSITGIQHRG